MTHSLLTIKSYWSRYAREQSTLFYSVLYFMLKIRSFLPSSSSPPVRCQMLSIHLPHSKMYVHMSLLRPVRHTNIHTHTRPQYLISLQMQSTIKLVSRCNLISIPDLAHKSYRFDCLLRGQCAPRISSIQVELAAAPTSKR